MGLDLRFSRNPGLESGFRAQRIVAGYRTHCRTELVRTAACVALPRRCAAAAAAAVCHVSSCGRPKVTLGGPLLMQMRTAAWTIAATKAYLEGSRGAAEGLALGALSSAALLPLYALVNCRLVLNPWRQMPLR